MLRNERRMRGVVRVKELRALGKKLETVDVTKGPAEREGAKEKQDEKAKKRPLHAVS